MLSNKPTLGFHNVLKFNFAVIAIALLMTITTLGAFDSETAKFNLTDTSAPLVTPTVYVSVGGVNTQSNVDITVPIQISGDVTGVTGYQAFMTFDYTALTFLGCETTGTLSEDKIFPSCSASFSGHPERLFIAATGGDPLSGSSGILLNLKFHVTNNYCATPDIDFGGWGTSPAFLFFGGDARNAVTSGDAVLILGAVTGTVTYGNAIGTPTPPRPVPNVLVSATSAFNNFSTTTNSSGVYLLDQFYGGTFYTVTPTKSNGNSTGSISSYDAALITQYVTQQISFTDAQITVADVSGNGSVSSFDASQVSTYASLTCGSCGNTGNWKFSPTNRTYSSCPNETDQDYSALQMGEVSGNWPNGGSGRMNGPVRNTAVLAPNLRAAPGKEIILPISVEQAADKGIISYEFNLRYDPTVIQPAADVVSLAKTVSGDLTVVANANEPGLLRVVVYGAYPIEKDGILLNLRFTAIGSPGSTSPLSWESLMFNEGDPQAMATDGLITISAAPSKAEEYR